MYRKFICRTNLDEYKREEWPEDFVFPPQIGQWVRAKSGRWLKVVSITHCHSFERVYETDPHPFVEIELHK